MGVDLVQLRSFLEVAERGTVAAAAAALGYTAPAVSQHVAKLGRALGARVFDRVGGHLRLAPPGRALVPVAHQMLDLASLAARVVQAPPARPRVVLAGFASAIAALVTPNLSRLADVVALEVVEAEDAPALRELRLGHVDVVLAQEYSGEPAERDRRLAYRGVARDELRLVLPPSFAAATTVADLGDVPWMLNGASTRCATATRRVLRTAGIDPRIVAEVSDNHALLDLVAAGHGVTVVPDLVLADARGAVTVADQHLGVRRTLVAVTRRDPASGPRAVVDAITPVGAPSPTSAPGPRTSAGQGREEQGRTVTVPPSSCPGGPARR